MKCAMQQLFEENNLTYAYQEDEKVCIHCSEGEHPHILFAKEENGMFLVWDEFSAIVDVKTNIPQVAVAAIKETIAYWESCK